MARSPEEEKEHMLPDDEEHFESNIAGRRYQRTSKSRTYTIHGFLFILQALFLAFNAGLFWNWSRGDCHSDARSVEDSTKDSVVAPFSPAASSVEYEVHTIDTHHSGSKFIGKPRPEVDEAWSDLLSATIVRISGDEMRQMNRTSSALRDGSGYAGYLEAYHMLHCVKRMYQFRHLDYYSEVEQKGFFAVPHWEHCVEVLRQGIMCHADLTINTIVQKNEVDLEGITAWPRKCTDWSRIKEWAEDRAVPLVPGSQASLLIPKGQEGEIGPADML